MEHVSSVRPTRKFPEKVENLKRWSRFPGWNFRTECRVPFTFLVVCTSSRSTVGHPATYRGLRPNGTTFYQSEIPLLLPPKFPGFFRKWKAPTDKVIIPVIICWTTSGKHNILKLSRFRNTRIVSLPFPQYWFHAFASKQNWRKTS